MRSYWKHFFLDNSDITLIEAGYQKYVPHQINHYRVKHEYVLHLVIDGKGTYKVNNKTYNLKANDGFILHRNNLVYYSPDEDDPWTICWIGMGGKNIQKHIEKTLIPSSNMITFKEDSLAKEYILNLVRFLMNNNPNYHSEYLLIFSQLYQILYDLNVEFPLPLEMNDSYSLMEPQLAEKIYDYIYETFLSNNSVNYIAKHFDISRNYLFKLCKEFYGQSPKQIIQELRMNQASQLLRGSQMPINEIAQFIGYKDPFVFSKMFKQYYNYSPSKFRRLDDADIDKALFIRQKFIERRMMNRNPNIPSPQSAEQG